MPEAGEYQCLMLYLQTNVGLSKTNLAAFIAVLGVLSIIAQTYVLSYLSQSMTQKAVIIISLTFSALQVGMAGEGIFASPDCPTVFTNMLLLSWQYSLWWRPRGWPLPAPSLPPWAACPILPSVHWCPTPPAPNSRCDWCLSLTPNHSIA